jgi:hypothetical protein
MSAATTIDPIGITDRLYTVLKNTSQLGEMGILGVTQGPLSTQPGTTLDCEPPLRCQCSDAARKSSGTMPARGRFEVAVDR